MPEETKLHRPWLVAVWPGMGNVALSAGYYLMAKLGMTFLSEFPTRELFDVEHVEVKDGLIRPGRMPRSRFFVWRNPSDGHDIVVFIGEAQPPLGKYAFCHKLIEFAQQLGVERVFTFAAMATQMHPEHDSRVFAAATDAENLEQLRQLDLTMLEDGQIGGLNGVLLGVAAESGLQGGCLLGEMPHIFAQLPFPKASLAVLQVFSRMTGIKIDFAELSDQAAAVEQHLGQLLAQVEEQMGRQEPEEEPFALEPQEEEGLAPEDEHHIEQLFEEVRRDRSKAYELKRELDRLEVFKEYEDRFLNLFSKSD
ncbi:MAG TPA: PAC2 family protein [Pirellulales bacterium]|jgi:proteasome assembly chaperone (PAC2) family protein|nr:PAC2 family protein [Pirellulales bacterium]